MENKKQHFIPKCYINAWVDSNTPPEQEPYVWVFSKIDKKFKKRAPNNLFKQSDMYTSINPDGSRNLELEQYLCVLESNFSKQRKKIIDRVELTNEDVKDICSFVAAMIFRTDRSEEHLKNEWKRTLKSMDEVKIHIDGLPDSVKFGSLKGIVKFNV